MPKIVDHDQRREEFADAALAVIAAKGIGGVTLRAVSEEAGASTGSLTHYFGNRDALMLGALRHAAARSEAEQRAFLKEPDPLKALAAQLESFLPLSEQAIAGNWIFIHYYGEAATDEVVRAEIVEYLRKWRKWLEVTLARAQGQGTVRPDLDTRAAAEDLAGLLEGMSVHAALDPEIVERLQERSPVPGWIAAITGADVSAVLGPDPEAVT